MKKIILLLSVFLFSLSSFAQRTSVGITVGSGLAWMSNTNQELEYKQSSNIGGTLVYSTKKHWGFGIDFKYSREGYRHTYPGTLLYEGKQIDERISSDFIRIPVRVIYFFNDNSHNIRPNISVGQSFGFLTGGKIRSEADNTIYNTAHVKDTFDSFDCGVQGTIGVGFKLAETLWLSTDIAYYHGLVAQNKYGSNNLMNRNLTLNLSLRIGVGE